MQQEPKSCRQRCGGVWGGGNLSIVFLLMLAVLVSFLE